MKSATDNITELLLKRELLQREVKTASDEANSIRQQTQECEQEADMSNNELNEVLN